MDNNNAKPQQNQLAIEINPQTTKVSYSNLAIISHSRSEFVLDFATTLPGLPKALVGDRTCPSTRPSSASSTPAMVPNPRAAPPSTLIPSAPSAETNRRFVISSEVEKSMNLLEIRAFALDIDGVFTDGSILCTTDGDLLRVYDAKDGFAIRMAVMNGYPVGIITGGSSESIRKRMLASGILPDDVYLHCRDKMEQFREFCDKYSLKPEEIMYFGDDVPDVEVLLAAGCGVCPSDAVEEAKAAADIVSTKPGGKGCIREVIEQTLKAQGKWVFDTGMYKKKF